MYSMPTDLLRIPLESDENLNRSKSPTQRSDVQTTGNITIPTLRHENIQPAISTFASPKRTSNYRILRNSKNPKHNSARLSTLCSNPAIPQKKTYQRNSPHAPNPNPALPSIARLNRLPIRGENPTSHPAPRSTPG